MTVSNSYSNAGAAGDGKHSSHGGLSTEQHHFEEFCSFAPLCCLWGFTAVLGRPLINHRENMLILGQLLVPLC